MNEPLDFEREVWRQGMVRVAGVDEAGVGPLAGPVVAAAVVFHPEELVEGVRDSKKLTASRRALLENEILRHATGVGIGLADPSEIDRLNIYQATLLAMSRAVKALPFEPEFVLCDARSVPGIGCPQRAIIKGDALSFTIGAASIVAKEHRDRLMLEFDREYPEYGFRRHKGYPTLEHRAALAHFGPCCIHRRSFAGVLREGRPQAERALEGRRLF